LEPNDNATQARKLWGKRPLLKATLDYWDDPLDWYRVNLARGQRLQVRVTGDWSRAAIDLSLWRPGSGLHGQKGRVARTAGPARTQHLSYRAPRSGWYEIKLQDFHHGGGRYGLQVTKSR
jgi:hypothetical protein